MEELTNSSENEVALESGTYELIRKRLQNSGSILRESVNKLNTDRKNILGSQEAKLLATDRITTDNNCIPYDMISIGDHFIFGYNVHIGLKTTTEVSDVFSIYKYENQSFHAAEFDLLNDKVFRNDFQNLYQYYKETQFVKFAKRGVHLYMIFKIGRRVNDLKAFKWAINENSLKYIDDRSIHEFSYPQQHDFQWTKTTRDDQRLGKHPHVSVKDKVFVETIGGDLTLKIEDNTDLGTGIYSEKVEFSDQTLDDALIYYAIVDHLVFLKILPYQEQEYRYLIFNSKLNQVIKQNSIAQACVNLPDDHGVIFPNGYYLQNGSYKKFDHQLSEMVFENSLPSPNGEDYLYIFYNQASGTYLLLPYNMISQSVATPIICHGYMLFPNGQMCYFIAEDEPKKHHIIQIWQTPFSSPDHQSEIVSDSYLSKIGNKDIVKLLADCNEVLFLTEREDNYTDLYYDIQNKATNILDSYYWLDKKEAYNLKDKLVDIKSVAANAIEAYEKVSQIKKSTKTTVSKVTEEANQLIRKIDIDIPESIGDFVQYLKDLRIYQGQVLSLKDLRYADLELIQKIEQKLVEYSERTAQHTIDFLLRDDALVPFFDKVEELENAAKVVAKTTEVESLEENIKTLSSELEMLTDVISNLKIKDPTHTTSIIESISAVFSKINKLKASLKTRKKDLLSGELKAEFASQVKLISQSVINYLDIIDTPAKADEYLSKIMIQLEDLDGKFGDFEEFVEKISIKREEIYEAFESVKLRLTEERNKKISSLHKSADRIIKSVGNKAFSFSNENELNGYFASDIMIAKFRDISEEILELGDSVKADALQSKLKSIKEDALRHLRDKKEIFSGGGNLIKLGNFNFNVNTQDLAATLVRGDDGLLLHLTGTDFYEKVEKLSMPEYDRIKDQELISEDSEIYRGEYLAYQIFEELRMNGHWESPDKIKYSLEDLINLSGHDLEELVRKFMNGRFNEGYVKGVHDKDTTIILQSLLNVINKGGLLRYPSALRVMANLYWNQFIDKDTKQRYTGKIHALSLIRQVFPESTNFQELLEDISEDISHKVPAEILSKYRNEVSQIAEYLFHQLCQSETFVIDHIAYDLSIRFKDYLKKVNAENEFNRSTKNIESNFCMLWEVSEAWVRAFLKNQQANIVEYNYIYECLLIILGGKTISPSSIDPVSMYVEGQQMLGSHDVMSEGNYKLHYNAFVTKLEKFQQESVPLFTEYQDTKKRLISEYESAMKLSEFKSKVMSSFVRNRLIDKVYLPLIGANLAKQIGAAGETKRTDLMGLLLLISPPGYGKTTLMEYVANRLGLVFMKINGPAIGHSVVSLDPEDASNASAKEELNKLALALEMGNNVMLYLDDIQHCNPEFLQKFISLCDAQRKIEGVYKGKSKTYDFRGKKVAVVMAGNPYTESGEKFKIPDMLANRADIYNLGDILGDSDEEFKLSYIENSMTSNPVLSKLRSMSKDDIQKVFGLAIKGDQEGIEFEGNISAIEVQEYVSVLKKMLVARDIILKVNAQYIYSAAQAEEFRIEPAFKLQGSYRNMNKIAEKILPMMNDDELETVIMSHYENEAQTLTVGAEANILKFKELTGRLSTDDKLRWKEIKEIFLKQQKLKGFGNNNQLGMLLEQVENVSENLKGIQQAISRSGIIEKS